MVTSNFTLTGKNVTIVARVFGGKPRYDLEIGLDTIAEGLSYNELIILCKDIRKEMAEVTTYYESAGKQLADFSREWDPPKEVEIE